jgi:hypothetical protein
VSLRELQDHPLTAAMGIVLDMVPVEFPRQIILASSSLLVAQPVDVLDMSASLPLFGGST